jgi:hypothetical protein
MRVVIFHADRHQRDLAERLSAHLTGGTAAIHVAGGAPPASAAPGYPLAIRSLARFGRKVWAKVRYLAPVSYVISFSLFGFYRARARSVIKRNDPDIIVLFEDNIGNFTHFIGAAAASSSIPYVVLPITIPNPREAASFFRSSRKHAVVGMFAPVVAGWWPQWTYNLDGHCMFRLPVADIIAMRCLSVDSAKPWILNSGAAVAICVESAATRAIYQRFGLDQHRLMTIGGVADDTLFEVGTQREERRRALMETLGLDPNRGLLVVAFPPNQFGAPSKIGFEYASFADLVDGWLQALIPLAGQINIVLRAHPRLSPDELAPFERIGCRVFAGRTEELVPLADVFAASISATIRWALALGIPVINYDCYRYRYDDYRGAQGMVLVEDQRTFASVLQEICCDQAAYRRLRALQELDRGNWGCIDGQFTTRFLALLKSVSGLRDDSLSVVPCALSH